MINKKSIFISIVSIAVVAVTALSTYAITYSIKEKNIFQDAAEKGLNISDMDEAEDFKYTKFDSSNAHEAKIDQNIPDGSISEDPKTNIYNKMLNTIDYFNNAAITMETSMLSDKIITVEYQTNINTNESYQSLSADSTVISEEYGSSGNMVCVYNTEKTYKQLSHPMYTREDTPYMPLEERIFTAEDGIPTYTYRRNITNCSYASYCLVPQEITFSYLMDFDKWDIEDDDFEYLDRKCIKITGRTSPYIGEKHSSDSFTMIVDSETGVLMQFTGTKDGQVSRYMKVTECSFETRAAVKQFRLEDYSDYREEN